jgi:hypothetical protein
MMNRMMSAKPPHKGAVTHHQDQSMKPVSLRVMKIKNISPKKPIPPDELELLFDIFFKIIFGC